MAQELDWRISWQVKVRLPFYAKFSSVFFFNPFQLTMLVSAITALSTWLVTTMLAVQASDAADQAACHFLPGDPEWPNQIVWDHLNQSVGGNLIRGIPLGQTCHMPHVDSEKCSQTQAQWLLLIP